MVSQTTLVQGWITRLGNADEVDLNSALSRFPELRDAVTPAGWSIEPSEGSQLRREGRAITGRFCARLAPPDVSLSADDNELGLVALSFDTAVDDDEFASSMEFENLEIPEGIQRRGTGRLIAGGLAQLGLELGLEHIVLHAENVGRYAWARCGFDFLDDEWRTVVVQAAADFARRLGRTVNLDAVHHPWDIANLPGKDVSRGDVEDAGGPRAPQGRRDATWKLGQALLLGPRLDTNHWFGHLPLTDSVHLDRYLFPHGNASQASASATPKG